MELERYSFKTLMMASMFFLFFLSSSSSSSSSEAPDLVENFYHSSCPNVESIVSQAVQKKLSQTVVTIAATLRLFFHDCFVTGCDASVMIASPTGDAEKDAPDNLSLAGDGFDTIIKAKQAVEAQCPGAVSCADVMAIAARDVVALAGGPSWAVELGRRDGLQSSEGLVAGNLPEPTFDLNLLAWIFRKNNLTITDMVALSGGGHTIGFSHCRRFSNRLYNATVDPTLNPSFARSLIQSCPRNVDPTVVVPLDPTTPFVFDNAYFKNLVNGEGLLTSDEVLFGDVRSRAKVEGFAANQERFFGAFTRAMVRLGRVGVKTGQKNQGEIRRDCTRFN